MTERRLPPNASVATTGEQGKMVAPAASRNVDAICELLARTAPTNGRALELASGTGQHVAAFAQRLSYLNWQPSEVAPDRRSSIDAYSKDLSNVAKAAHLDATSSGWHNAVGGQDLIILINLLHLISWPETETLISEASLALKPGGRFIFYGPFMRDGRLTSDGDQRFHDALVRQDPEIGYKNDVDIRDLIGRVGLDLLEVAEMPANNLAFITQKQNI